MIRTGPDTLGWNSTVVRKTLGRKQAIKLVFASAAMPNARDSWECSRSEELPQSASTSTRHVEQLEHTSHHPARADHQFGHTAFEGSTNGSRNAPCRAWIHTQTSHSGVSSAAFWYRVLWEELLPNAALNEGEVTALTSLWAERKMSHPQF